MRDVQWGTSRSYRGRAHVLTPTSSRSLCGMPIDTRYTERPAAPLMCPECAIAYVTAVFPAHAPDLYDELRLRA